MEYWLYKHLGYSARGMILATMVLLAGMFLDLIIPEQFVVITQVHNLIEVKGWISLGSIIVALLVLLLDYAKCSDNDYIPDFYKRWWY